MTLTGICILLAVAYGTACAGVYTWLSPKRRGSWPVMFRAWVGFTALGCLLAGAFYYFFR